MTTATDTRNPYGFVRPEYRRLLDNLFFLYPEAKRLFEAKRILAAITILKEAKVNTRQIDKDLFLFYIQDAMPTDWQYDG
jgi:hypothetical protein